MMLYGFIGCGNMGGALARAAARAVGGEAISLADADFQKAWNLAEEIGAKPLTPAAMAMCCDYIILGVKPQNLEEVLKSFYSKLGDRRPVIISMAAGVDLAKLEALAPGCPLIRIMPNTPVAVGKGVILYAAKAGEREIEGFLKLFGQAGKLIPLEERLIDAGTAVSGCGPAYVYLFIEALADGGVSCGLPREQAVELAAGVVEGAAKMVLETGAHPGALKDAVCSPGGSTIEGVCALEQGAFRATTANAVIKAYEKTQKLGK